MVPKTEIQLKTTDKQQNDGDMTSYVKNISIIMLNNFYHDKHRLKIKLRHRKRRLSPKISEKRKNDTTKTGNVMKIKFCSKCIFIHDKHR